MPTLAIFYGVAIQMFWYDHAPPHFHAVHGEHEAQLAMDGALLNGSLPPRVLAMVREWARSNQDGL